MTLSKRAGHELSRTRSLLNALIELPDLAAIVQTLPVPAFSALIRKLGVEDAGELIALATTEQLVQAFDEDLFVNERAGERESLDVGRFVVWLEVLLEAGDTVVADRVAELDEDFVAHALGGVFMVLDEDALRDRLDEVGEDEVRQVDKSLESALTEELDGYLLIAKQHDGWDAVLALVLALDRNHRALLVRLLDRLALVGDAFFDDLEQLLTVLSEGESLAEDAEAAREERRSRQGYVDARSARGFLLLAKKPAAGDERPTERDPLTRAYFREIERGRRTTTAAPVAQAALQALPAVVLHALGEDASENAKLLNGAPARTTTLGAFSEALRELSRTEPSRFGERMEEFAYLANVLIAGHERNGARLRAKEAADAVIATVCYGAVVEIRAIRAKTMRKLAPTPLEFAEVLRQRSADILFRVGSGALAAGVLPAQKGTQASGLLYSEEELVLALSLKR